MNFKRVLYLESSEIKKSFTQNKIILFLSARVLLTFHLTCEYGRGNNISTREESEDWIGLVKTEVVRSGK